MPRYFFNLDHHDHQEDLEGTELPGPDAARVAAVIFAGEYLRDNPGLIWDGRHFRVEVRNQRREILLTVNVAAEDPAEA